MEDDVPFATIPQHHVLGTIHRHPAGAPLEYHRDFARGNMGRRPAR